MANTLKLEYSTLKEVIDFVPSRQKSSFLILVNTNILLKKLATEQISLTFPVTIQLILPKSVIFDPPQNNHIILDSLPNNEEIMLSWLVKCLTLPCLKEEVGLAIIF